MRLNPLWNWDRQDTIDWIEKKKDFMKFRDMTATEAEEDSEDEFDDNSDQLVPNLNHTLLNIICHCVYCDD
jgi:hypothetical protein